MNMLPLYIQRIVFLFALIINITVYGQIKIGDNPGIMDLDNSILELESTDKVLVITRMDNLAMISITPKHGALVYNTTNECIYTYTGTTWKSLCDGSTSATTTNITRATTAPTGINTGDFWIDTDNNNNVSIWDAANSIWIPIDTNPTRGSGIPTVLTAANPSAGDIYVDETTGLIYAYDGTTWISSGTTLTANNGITIDNDVIQLGGVLTMPTTIATNGTDTIAITGLEENTDITNNDIVVVNNTTGILTRTPFSNVFREEVIDLNATINDQVDFTFALKTNTEKVNVYRNGVRIDFTLNESTSTVTLEPEASCYVGDQIRIVQFY